MDDFYTQQAEWLKRQSPRCGKLLMPFSGAPTCQGPRGHIEPCELHNRLDRPTAAGWQAVKEGA